MNSLATRKILRSFSYYALVPVACFLMLYPVLWLIAGSFKTQSELVRNAHSLIPAGLDFRNYLRGWTGFAGVSFATFFGNSFVIVGLSTIGQVLSSALVAYGFARIRFAGRKVLFMCMIATIMLPAQVLYIPQYIIFNLAHWLNTYLPLIIPSFFGTPFFIFLIMQFIRGIPAELDESARMDGCGHTIIFRSIIVPLVKPALITSGIFAFYWKWEEFFEPLIYLNRLAMYPVSIGLKIFSDPEAGTNWGELFAMSTLSLVPVFLVFVLFQRYLVEGISTTGLKG
jgi:multiple sugar transport system permease protein